MWYFKTVSPMISGSYSSERRSTFAWVVNGTFAVVFADGSALVTKGVRGGSTLSRAGGCSVDFEVSLGDLIVPEYPIGMEKMWLDGLVKADTEVVRYHGRGKGRQA